MSVKIMAEPANCACGTPLDDVNQFVDNDGDDVCRDCWRVENAEDEEIANHRG